MPEEEWRTRWEGRGMGGEGGGSANELHSIPSLPSPPHPVHWAPLAVISLRFLRIHKSYIHTYIHTVNVKNFAVEIFSLYSRAPLHRENIVREMSPCFSRVTLLFAVDSLWNFTITSSQFVPWRCFTRPQGTTLHNNPATGNRRSKQGGTRSGDRESLEEEGQLPSL